MIWEYELKEEGCYNLETPNERKFWTSYLRYTKNYQSRVQLPTNFLIAPTDLICFYSETITGFNAIRRICEIVPKDVYDKNPIHPSKNPRKPHKQAKHNSYWCIVPITKLEIKKDGWTHLRFHKSPDLNLYYLEFLKIDKFNIPDTIFEDETNQPSSYIPQVIIPTSGIRWD